MKRTRYGKVKEGESMICLKDNISGFKEGKTYKCIERDGSLLRVQDDNGTNLWIDSYCFEPAREEDNQ